MRYDQESKTIIFKSIPEVYKKEKTGLKPNTVRTLKNKEYNNLINTGLWTATHIKIVNSADQNESFKRVLSDISIYPENAGIWDYILIFSWKHVDGI